MEQMGEENLDQAQLERELREIIVEVGGLAPDFNPAAHLYNDLGMASVKALRLLVALEERYNIQIEDEAFVEAYSLNNLQSLMSRLMP